MRVLSSVALLVMVGIGASVSCCSWGGAPSDVSRTPSAAAGPGPEEVRVAPSLRPDGDDGAFPSRIEFDGEPLVLNGSGLCEWGFLGIDLYRAALYRPAATRDAATIIEAPTRSVLHLHFVRGLTKKQLEKAYTASVEVNTGDLLQRFQPALDALCSMLTKVDKGGSLTYIIDPARGIEVLVDERSRGRVEDPAFARLFLEMHVGDKPPTAKLRAGLLGA